MSLVVLCAGGHARVVIEALRSRGARPRPDDMIDEFCLTSTSRKTRENDGWNKSSS
jgi:hypothetical protein